VNLLPFMTICFVATLGLLQAGCASSPTTGAVDLQPGSFEVGDRPQMAFPGATRAEVKALAMGSARSRAWTIVESTDDLLVVRRTLDASSPAARALGPSVAVPGSLVEVTSYFLEDRGGVKVALDASLVSQASGPDKPTRTDVTETFRPSLDESLSSLHASWSRNRVRVARAAPPLGGARADGAGASDSADAALADAGEPRPAGSTSEAAPAIPPASSRTPAAAAAATAWSTPAPTTPRQPPPLPTRVADAPAAPTPEPRRPVGGPAPIVDASPALTRTTPGATTQPMSLPDPLPQPVAEPIPDDENMMALSPSSGSVSWSYYAEQYARLRGCNVGPQGSILIDSRSDGEIHKVPCEGADSVLVQCRDGECRGLL
jgi:hypothetical protein